jgi:lysozyme
MMLSRAGFDLVREFEGLSLVPYLCPAGYWTIGYGATRDAAGAPVGPDTAPIVRSGADALLARDLVGAGAAVQRLCPPLAQPRFDALVSFTFNLGAGALRASRLRRCVAAGDHDQAALEFLRWVYAGGRRLTGLMRRRAAEAALYRAG